MICEKLTHNETLDFPPLSRTAVRLPPAVSAQQPHRARCGSSTHIWRRKVETVVVSFCGCTNTPRRVPEDCSGLTSDRFLLLDANDLYLRHKMSQPTEGVIICFQL